MRLRLGLALTAVALVVCAAHSAAEGPASPPNPVHIGLVNSLFVDVPDPLVGILMKPFSGLMRDLTGLNGKAAPAGDAYAIAEKLKDGKLHLGAFQGFEFAWVQQKYPKLKPLMIAVYYDRHLRASIVVHKDCPAQAIAGLRGTELALPMGTKGHCRLFLQRHCTNANGPCDPKAFFSEVRRTEHAEAALDLICDGKVQCAVIDEVSWQCYKGVKSGPAKRLKVLSQSEVFPAGVIAYYDGGLDQATLNCVTRGLADATKNRKAIEIMSLFKITSFEEVPEDYADTLANIRRLYPPPPEALVAPAKGASNNAGAR